MVTVEEVRGVALGLPRAYEALVRDRVKFRVGRIVFATLSRDETVLGFGFPKAERAGVVAARPDVFLLPPASDMRYQWVCARMAALDPDEMRELILGAWEMCVPKRVAADYFGTPGSAGSTHERQLPSIGWLLPSMAGDVRGMVRSEIRGTVDELTGKVTGRVRSAGRGAALLGGAGAMGALSLGTGAVFVVRVLEALLPRRTAAFFATLLFGAAAAGLGAAGVAEIKRSAARDRSGRTTRPAPRTDTVPTCAPDASRPSATGSSRSSSRSWSWS